MPGKQFQRRHWIGQIHENKASNKCVEQLGMDKVSNLVRKEVDIGMAGLGGPFRSPSDVLRIAINSHNRSLLAHEISREEGDVTNAGPDVENTHSRTNTGRSEGRLYESTQDGALAHQTLPF